MQFSVADSLFHLIKQTIKSPFTKIAQDTINLVPAKPLFFKRTSLRLRQRKTIFTGGTLGPLPAKIHRPHQPASFTLFPSPPPSLPHSSGTEGGGSGHGWRRAATRRGAVSTEAAVRRVEVAATAGAEGGGVRRLEDPAVWREPASGAQPHSPSLPPTLHTHATTRIRPRHPSSASTAGIRPRLSSTCIGGDRASRIIAPLHHCTVFVRSSARSRRAAAAAAGDLLDHPRDVRHARPALRLRDGAPHPDPQQPHGGRAGAGGDDGVDDLLLGAAGHRRRRPLHDVGAAARREEVLRRELPRDELEEHDAEAVHVGPRRQGGALGSGAGAGGGGGGGLGRPEREHGVRRLRRVDEREEAVVHDAGLQVGVEQDVAGLEVAVRRRRRRRVEVGASHAHQPHRRDAQLLVEVRQAAHHADGDPHPRRPIQHHPLRALVT
uniref:Uncharacterized protein n=1 Tax=Oryza sativa TaxID=4530 RepID=Q9XEU9_ORYSA|nr:hypothetical protein [Oryza sativa Japonica Group]